MFGTIREKSTSLSVWSLLLQMLCSSKLLLQEHPSLADNVSQQDGNSEDANEGIVIMLLKTKLANRIKAIDSDIEMVRAKNVSVNGMKRGCSGFCVKDGRTVYFDTSVTPMLGQKEAAMWRYARDATDYASVGLVDGDNHWCAPDELANRIASALR